MSRPVVSLQAQSDYCRESLASALHAMLEPLGGMACFVPRGARVLLKPNLVFGRHPDKAVNTHPEVVRAVASMAFAAGASWVGLGDSPGFGSAKTAAKASGLLAVTKELGLELVEFTPYEDASEQRFFHKLELAREIREADVVINLPKLKTHGQMLMTLAVKNMFGAVPGARKLQWHYRAGRDQLLFARAINEIALAARPHLSILDAVVGMDGMGPSAGRARPVGFLAASDDPWALDAAVMDVLGLERSRLFTLAAAMEHGPGEWLDMECVGADAASLRPDDWQIPEMYTLQMHGGFVEKHLPSLAAWLRSRITPAPAPKPECIACGYCVEICPARAMRLEGKRVVIDEAKCIRCYCCHELCQYHAMGVRPIGLLGRLLGLGQ